MMRKITKYYLESKIAYLKANLLILVLCFLLFPSYQKVEKTGDNSYKILLNGVEVGVLDSKEDARECLKEARSQLAASAGKMVFVDTDLQFQGEELIVGKVDLKADVIQNMYGVLDNQKKTTLNLAYMLKINEFYMNLASKEDVLSVLQAALNKYDANGEFLVDLELDPNREINVLTTKVTNTEARADETQDEMPVAGLEKQFHEIDAGAKEHFVASFDDIDYGVTDVNFEDKIEVVETYLPFDQIMDVATAVDMVTKDQAKDSVYTVQSGDTLSEIAIKVNIPLDSIVAMNESLEDENSSIREGQDLVITRSEPVVSILSTEVQYSETTYEAEVQYVDNTSWYTNKQVTLQQPSAGYRKYAAVKSYRNNELVSEDILKEHVTVQAVPKIIEKGTITPPTYVKPISGGRLTSNFGPRKAPKRGASRYHKGIDWATPVGTAVYASCGGTVAKAGWGSGYGYVVYINHPDGRQTRYGHCSKVLVKAGDKVSQGQKIALSGNTGVSTGPHLHFEILIGGSQVNPLKYMN